jgi:hypothetical protein
MKNEERREKSEKRRTKNEERKTVGHLEKFRSS